MSGGDIALVVSAIIVGGFILVKGESLVRGLGGPASNAAPHVRFRVFLPLRNRAGQRSIFFLPGVQSRGEEALLPADRSAWEGVLGALRTHGYVITATYVREKFFAPRQVVAEIVARVEQELSLGREVVLLGSSFGGMLAVDVVKEIDPMRRRNIRLVLISSPFGASDLLAGGNILGPILKWTRLDWLLSPVLSLFRLPAGTISAGVIQPGLHVKTVQAEGRTRSSGFSVSGLFRQVGYMARWRFPGLPVRAAYVQCLHDKVVKQPNAGQAWQKAYPALAAYPILTAHCEYLGEPQAFIGVLGEILDD